MRHIADAFDIGVRSGDESRETSRRAGWYAPLAAPTWRAPDYTLVVHRDRAGDGAVMAFERWITSMAGPDPGVD